MIVYLQTLDSAGAELPLTKMSGLTQLVHEKGLSMCLSEGGVKKRVFDMAETKEQG